VAGVAKDWAVYIIIYAMAMTYFVLKTFGDPALFSVTITFLVMAAVSMIAALYGEFAGFGLRQYHQDLSRMGLLFTLGAVVGMIVVSSLFVQLWRSVLYYPTVFAVLASIGGTSSVFTSFLGEMVYQFTAVATGEECLKFCAYSTLKNHYRSTVLAVAVAVGFWAGFHALQAYKDVFYVIPAFACGIILIWLLETTRSIIAPVIAHGVYNSICILHDYVSQPPPVMVPFFPATWTPEDCLLMGLAAMIIAFTLLPIIRRRGGP